jgi:hypothetical protein
MFRARRPLISVPAFPSSDLCASGFGSLRSFCSGGSSDPFTRPFAPVPSNCLPLALRNEGNEVRDLLFLSYPLQLPMLSVRAKREQKSLLLFMHLQTSFSTNSFLSYSYKFQGGVFLLPQGLVPSFVVLAPDLSRRNCRKPFPFMHLLHNSRTPQGGTANSFPSRAFRAMNPGCPLPCSSILGPVAYKSRNTDHVFSALLSGLCVSALSLSALFLSTLNCRLSTSPLQSFPSHQSRITSHRFHNFYPPAPKLRHNPAAQGRIKVQPNDWAQPNPHTGRIQ